MNLTEEFNIQVQNLFEKGYPKLANLTKKQFLDLLEPLRQKLAKLNLPEINLEKGTLPFVIVIKSDLIAAEKMMELVEKDGQSGVTKLFPHTSTNFQPTSDVELPSSQTYLLVDINRGKDNINLPPSEALKIIKNKNRSPLTIDEGIAVVTHYPQFLIKNNCFSLLSSRHPGDKRVPAIWINSKKQPNLGWCWDGNPHTWLGSASAKTRI